MTTSVALHCIAWKNMTFAILLEQGLLKHEVTYEEMGVFPVAYTCPAGGLCFLRQNSLDAKRPNSPNSPTPLQHQYANSLTTLQSSLPCLKNNLHIRKKRDGIRSSNFDLKLQPQ
jgi:hypothetical protein